MSNLAIMGGDPIGKVNIPKWPIFDQKEINAVQEVVKSGEWAYLGVNETEFERKFSQFCGTKYSITATNGTHTLRLALEALGVGPGDEVIIPGLTWQATAASVLDVNAIPVMVDIDPDTYTIDPAAVEAAITPRTKCIIPVHLYGRIADMDAIMSIARKYKLSVLEDCAHQHGSEWRGKKVGSIGDIGSFSLQSSKVLNCGEGGVLITNNDNLGHLLHSLKNCGKPYKDNSLVMQSGNYRMTEFQAAIVLIQLSRLKEQNALREKNAKYLENSIARIEGLEPLYMSPNTTSQVYYYWTIKYDSELWGNVPKGIFMKALSAELQNSIECVSPYAPLTNSPFYHPLTKNTHKLSNQYWNSINPTKFDLPVCWKAHNNEAVNFYHTTLLAENTEECDKIIHAIEKLRDNMDELLEYNDKLTNGGIL